MLKQNFLTCEHPQASKSGVKTVHSSSQAWIWSSDLMWTKVTSWSDHDQKKAVRSWNPKTKGSLDLGKAGEQSCKNQEQPAKMITCGNDHHIWRPLRAEVKQKVGVPVMEGWMGQILLESEILRKILHWTLSWQKETKQAELSLAVLQLQSYVGKSNFAFVMEI